VTPKQKKACRNSKLSRTTPRFQPISSTSKRSGFKQRQPLHESPRDENYDSSGIDDDCDDDKIRSHKNPGLKRISRQVMKAVWDKKETTYKEVSIIVS